MTLLKKRVFNLALMCRVVFRAAVRGREHPPRTSPKVFGVVYATRNVGDMVCATPLFSAIKRSNPAARVIVIGSSRNAPLIEGHPDVDAYVDADAPFGELVRRLQPMHIDAGIVAGNSTREFAALYLGGARTMSCFRLTKEYQHMDSLPYRVVSRFGHRTEYIPGEYVPAQFLNLLSPFGIRGASPEKTLAVSDAARERVDAELQKLGIGPDEPLVAVAPGAGAAYKQWSPSRFAQVANFVSADRGLPVVLVGSPADAAVVANVVSSLAAGVRYWSPGPQPLDTLKATLARSAVVVGNDSGAVHIAEALGTMTVTIAGPTDVGEHLRPNQRHRILTAPARPGERYRAYIVDERKIKVEDARRVLDAVTEEMVQGEVAELLDLNARESTRAIMPEHK